MQGLCSGTASCREGRHELRRRRTSHIWPRAFSPSIRGLITTCCGRCSSLMLAGRRHARHCSPTEENDCAYAGTAVSRRWCSRNTWARGQEYDAAIADDSIPDRCHHFYEVPVPDTFKEGRQRTREITVSLAHSPAVRTTRITYKSCEMEFRLVWADDLTYITQDVQRATSREQYQSISEATGARIGARNRGAGTVQADTWTLLRVSAQRRAQRLFLVITRIDEGWGRALTLIEEPYALAVTLRERENAEAQLYAQIQAQLRVRLPTRIRT